MFNLMTFTNQELTDLRERIEEEQTRRIFIRNSLEPLNDHEKDLLIRYHKIRAIKAYRNRTGCGLREAKWKTDEYPVDTIREAMEND